MAGVFDPVEKERQLREESAGWDTSAPVPAEAGDVPVVDVGPYFASGAEDDLRAAAGQLRVAAEEVGFHQLVGHRVPVTAQREILDAAARFHALPLQVKSSIRMDRPEWPVGGVGYLPVGERKLPRRSKGNVNEAFLVKSDVGLTADDNQWLDEADLPGFRAVVESYARTISTLAMRLLPVYAVALDLERDYFTEAFRDPFWRLRLTHYPPYPAGGDDEYGIAPHVDTTFFTLLLQDGPGLVIYSHRREAWVSVPVVDGAYVVNSGELLRQWSNDRFLSTRHFADNPSGRSRYSVPFFFNANADHLMECLPTCHGPGNPPKYPPVSYRQSQAAVQGE